MKNSNITGFEERKRITQQAVNVGLFSNIILAVIKTSAGVLGNSHALLADGINSTSDVAYYILVKIFTRVAGKPADPEHPFGHSQMESIAAIIVGAFVVTTAIAIFWNSVNSVLILLSGPVEVDGILARYTLFIVFFTILIKIALTSYTKKIAQTTSNAAVLALAHDHRNDIFASLGVAVGIWMGRMGYSWIDPLAGAFVALIILKTGINILRESASELMDTIPSAQLDLQIRQVLSPISGIEEIEDIRAHRFGPYFVINITIGVDGELTVTGGDEIATKVEKTLTSNMELVKKVYVHFHPAGISHHKPEEH